MSLNCTTHKKGSNVIASFVKEARLQNKRDLVGSNYKLTGLNLNVFDFFWTEDEATPIYNPEGNIIGYEETIDQLTPASDENIVDEIDIPTTNRAIKELKKIAGKSYSQVDTYVESNTVEDTLKYFGKILLGLCKLMFRHISRSDH